MKTILKSNCMRKQQEVHISTKDAVAHSTHTKAKVFVALLSQPFGLSLFSQISKDVLN